MNKKKIIIYQILLIIICVSPVISTYFSNIGGVPFREFILPLIINIVICEILYLIYIVIYKNMVKSIIYSLITFYIIINFKKIDIIFQEVPFIYYWHTIIILIMCCFILFNILNKLNIGNVLEKILLFVSIGVIASNIFILFENKPEQKEEIIQKVSQDNITNYTATKTNLPDIYIIILDEYSSFKQIKKWYNYDNKVFYDFLKENNFNIILDSQNESINISTSSITTNMLNLNYVVTDNDYILINDYRKNPPLFSLMDQNSYDVNYMGGPGIEWNDKTVKRVSKTIDGKNIYDILYENNILYPFKSNDIYKEVYLSEQQQWETLNEIINDSKKRKFAYFHFNGPHVPYVFDKEGNFINKENRVDFQDTVAYVDAYKYTTKKTMDVIKSIIQKDPKSIIFVFSDHSMRHLQDKNGKRIIPTKDSQQIFNAVYVGGETIEFKSNESAVNTLRKTLSKVFGIKLEEVNVP